MEKKYETRALILQEFRAGRNERVACKNICRQLGPKSVTLATVMLWYGRFRSDDTTLRDKNDKNRHNPVQVNSNVYLPVNRLILFKTCNTAVKRAQFTTSTGRLAIMQKRNHGKPFLVDLFHGRIMNLRIRDNPLIYGPRYHYAPAALEDDKRFLVVECEPVYDESEEEDQRPAHFVYRIFLLALDAATSTSEILSGATFSAAREVIDHILVDQTNNDQFVLLASEDATVRRGRITDNNTVSINDPISLPAPVPPHQTLCFPVLNNGTLRGLIDDGIEACFVWEYDLNNRTSRVGTPIPDTIQRHFVSDLSTYIWSKSGELYVSICSSDLLDRAQSTVYRLDIEARTWSEINIGGGGITGRIADLFVDDEGILTFRAQEESGTAFYRFPLKKPDSLVNLAWSFIRFRSNLAGSDLYEKIRDRLPFNCHLRSCLPDI